MATFIDSIANNPRIRYDKNKDQFYLLFKYKFQNKEGNTKVYLRKFICRVEEFYQKNSNRSQRGRRRFQIRNYL
jgi:hypothetical protein